jgi:hypothetical protein
MLFETRDLALITRANEYTDNGKLHEALADLDEALTYFVTPHARWNRSQVLMSLNDYRAGAPELEVRWQLFSGLLDSEGMRAATCAPLWTGEEIAGKRLLLYFEAGYGDAVMLLRYVPLLLDMRAELTLLMPPPLKRLAAQWDDVPVIDQFVGEYDFRCPMFSLLQALDETPESVPDQPYLDVDPQWGKPTRDDGRKRIGIAWSSERAHAVERLIPLEQLMAALPDCQLYSLQNHAQKQGERYDVQTFQFTDFAELAALIARMDAIVSIDTAALNLAGAIGHPKVNALLPFAPVWRWHNPRWYPQIHQCRCEHRGDWASALAQLKL